MAKLGLCATNKGRLLISSCRSKPALAVVTRLFQPISGCFCSVSQTGADADSMNHAAPPGMNQDKLCRSPEGQFGERQRLHPLRARSGAWDLHAAPWARPGAGQDPAHVTAARVTGGALAVRTLARARGKAREDTREVCADSAGGRAGQDENRRPRAQRRRLRCRCPWTPARLRREQPTRMLLPRPHRAQAAGKHRTHVLIRGPPTFSRHPSHHSEPEEAVVPAAAALHVFAVRHGCSLACARLRATLLCVRPAARHSEASRPGKRG